MMCSTKVSVITWPFVQNCSAESECKTEAFSLVD